MEKWSKEGGCHYLLLQESRLISGVGFKKTFSYAGFEMQPKKYEQPKIALLNIELELKAEKENAELRIDNVEVWDYECLGMSILNECNCRNIRRWWMPSGPFCTTNWMQFSRVGQKWSSPSYPLEMWPHSILLIGMVSGSSWSAVAAVFCIPIRDVFCAGRVPEEDLRRTMRACGGAIQTSVSSLTDTALGTCQLFQEEQIGGERWVG